MFRRKEINELTELFVKIKKIYNQPESERISGWQNVLLTINAKPSAWAAYISSITKITQNDILFFNFLIDNGVSYEILRPYQTALIQKSIHSNSFVFLKWLIETCHFMIGRAQKESLSSLKEHPLGLVLTNVDTKIRDYLLEKMSDRTVSCDSPLIIAARFGYQDLFDYLLNVKRLDPNEINVDNETPIMYAIKNKSKNMVAKLLENNAILSVLSKKHLTVFHYAIASQDVLILIQLINHFNSQTPTPDLNTIQGDRGVNLLHYVIQTINDPNLTKSILKHLFKYMDKYVINKDGQNLAFFACISGKIDVAEWLVSEQQIDLNSSDNNGMNVLHICIQYGLDIGFKWLLSKSFNIEARTPQGDTALLLEALTGGDKFIDELLLRADTKASNQLGCTIGHYLTMNNQAPKLKLLLEKNTLILNTKTHLQQTILDIALERDHTEILHNLFTYMHKKRKQGPTEPLRNLVHHLNFEKLLEFICSNANISDYRYVEQGQPPLHWACLERNRQLIKDLQEKYHLNINQRNEHGESPLALMINMQYFEQAQWFCDEFHPELFQIDNKGSSALHLACEQGNVQFATLLLHKKPTLLRNLRSSDNLDALEISILQQKISLTHFIWKELIKKTPADDLIKLYKPEYCSFLTKNKIYQPPEIISTEESVAGDRTNVAIISEPSIKSVAVSESTLESFSLPEITVEWIIDSINKNNLENLKKLKHRPDLEDFFAHNAQMFAFIAFDAGHSRITYQLLRIPGIYQNLTDHDFIFLSCAISTDKENILRALLNCDNIRNSAHEANNSMLNLAINLGKERLVLELLACQQVRDNAHLNNNLVCMNASKHPHILMYLLELENVRSQILLDTEYTLLLQLVSIGDLDNLVTLLNIHGMIQSLPKETLIKAYTLSKESMHEEISIVLLEFPDVRNHVGMIYQSQETSVIVPLNHYVQTSNVFYILPNYTGPWVYQPIDMYLVELPSIESPTSSMSLVEHPHIEIPRGSKRDDFYSILFNAVDKKSYTIVRYLITDRFITYRAVSFYHHLCWVSIRNSDLRMLEILFSCPNIEKQLNNKHQILCWAIKYEEQNIVSFLLTDAQVRAQLSERNLYALRLAIQTGNLEIVNQLLAINSIKQQASTLNNYALRIAISKGITSIIHSLLKIPNVFKNANSDNTKFDYYIAGFVLNKLQDRPSAEDMSYETFMLYRLIFCYCIKQNKPYWNSLVIKLLQNSTFRNSAHINVDNYSEPNELLQLAQLHNNVDIARALLSIPQVKEIAIKNGFYRNKNPGLRLDECIAYNKPNYLFTKSEELGVFFKTKIESDIKESKLPVIQPSCC